MHSQVPPHVVIAGGGVAALETLMALRAQAGAGDLQITLLAPDRDFRYRPMTVAEPFSIARAHRRRAGGHRGRVRRRARHRRARRASMRRSSLRRDARGLQDRLRRARDRVRHAHAAGAGRCRDGRRPQSRRDAARARARHRAGLHEGGRVRRAGAGVLAAAAVRARAADRTARVRHERVDDRSRSSAPKARR